MRKTLFSLALAMAVLSSCSSDDIVNNPMNEENHSFPASRSLHENILSFSSEEEYNALLDSLGTLSDEELLLTRLILYSTTRTAPICRYICRC